MDPTITPPSSPPGQAPGTPELIAARIDERLRRHLEARAVEQVREAVVRGQVVRVGGPETSAVVAFKRGVLFIAGVEYVISDD